MVTGRTRVYLGEECVDMVLRVGQHGNGMYGMGWVGVTMQMLPVQIKSFSVFMTCDVAWYQKTITWYLVHVQVKLFF